MDQTVTAETLLHVTGVRQSYHKESNADLVVLDNVELDLRAGEIVGLLGRSGSGKSTLLRIIAGLLAPSAGTVAYQGRDVVGPSDGVAMVFQSFALFPWLTVLENVELGLEAKGVAKAERRRRAVQAIDLIGLDGFESAYPKELSGGMRQRVGLARALVVHPDLLLMDEPFSALDALTRTRIQDLAAELLHGRTVLLITHDPLEACRIGHHVRVLSGQPACLGPPMALAGRIPRAPDDPDLLRTQARLMRSLTENQPA